MNYYVPLTPIGGASALFLESRPGSEDWHPIVSDYDEVVKHFARAICVHWTTENTTDLTRVSLDFRLIAGPMFHALTCAGSHPGEQRDVYRLKDGYYAHCRRVNNGHGVLWKWEGAFQTPDARVSFSCKVNNWGMLLDKEKANCRQ